ncbi:hypothetical protein, partial [Salmonella sp. ZJJH19_0126]|uniref:hypothetical protein n=1 Tax=Salmonella sp. ZJJH19_0126 TaxID=3159613 RepID=UPI003981197E
LIDLDKQLLSFVAKSLNLTVWNNYLAALLICIISLLFFWQVQLPRKSAVAQQTDLIQRRQKTALYRTARNIVLLGL